MEEYEIEVPLDEEGNEWDKITVKEIPFTVYSMAKPHIETDQKTALKIILMAITVEDDKAKVQDWLMQDKFYVLLPLVDAVTQLMNAVKAKVKKKSLKPKSSAKQEKKTE